MKQRFGIEIETIAKHSQNTLANKIYRQIDLADKGLQVDTNNHAYHSHIANKWGFENDGSLRPNTSFPFGCEIISPPLKIDRLWEVKKILEVLKNKIATNKSCGLHVHIECKDVETVKNVLLIWRKFETQIIKSFPISRHNNGMCKKINRMTTDRLLGMRYGRHHMINSESWAYRGTVEFRGHAGTVNFNKIKRWILFAAKIVEVAKSYNGRPDVLAAKLATARDVFKFLDIRNTKTAKYLQGRIKHFEKLAS